MYRYMSYTCTVLYVDITILQVLGSHTIALLKFSFVES